MQPSIVQQIWKLDKDLTVCKEHLASLSKINEARKKAKPPMVSDKEVMDRRKRNMVNCPSGKSDKGSKSRTVGKSERAHSDHNPRTRSRSVSGFRNLKLTEDDQHFQRNNLSPKENFAIPRKRESSWGNILKEQNLGPPRDDYYYSRKMYAHSPPSKEPRDKDLNNIIRPSKDIQDWKVQPEAVYMKNRAIQCSESVFLPTSSQSSIGHHFNSYDPKRTLEFLLTEFRANFYNRREDKLVKIMSDMEDAVSRMNKCKLVQSDSQQTDFYPCKVAPSIDGVSKSLAESYSKLETMYEALEVSCSKLKEEKQRLKLEADSNTQRLKLFEAREKTHLEKIASLENQNISLTQKNDQQISAVHELTKMLSKIQEENRTLDPLRDSQTRLKEDVKRLMNDKDSLNTEYQLLQLENKKNKLIIEIKDQEINVLKEEIRLIKDEVSDEEARLQMTADQLVTSSPNSSVDGPHPYSSWQQLSSIPSSPPRSSALRHEALRAFRRPHISSDSSNQPSLPSSPSQSSHG